MPFVDSKGNFGKVYSRDMAYAASRYTEVKLDPFCAGTVRATSTCDAVDFVDNYDGTMKEPTLLPTTLPQCAGQRQHWALRWAWLARHLPGFNLNEVCTTAIA